MERSWGSRGLPIRRSLKDISLPASVLPICKSDLVNCFQGGVVIIALGTASVERFLARRIESRIQTQALREVGIGDEKLTEGNKISLLTLNRVNRAVALIATVGHVGTVENVPEFLIVEAVRTVFHHMKVGKAILICLLDNRFKRDLRIEVGNVIERICWRDAYADLTGLPD